METLFSPEMSDVSIISHMGRARLGRSSSACSVFIWQCSTWRAQVGHLRATDMERPLRGPE